MVLASASGKSRVEKKKKKGAKIQRQDPLTNWRPIRVDAVSGNGNLTPLDPKSLSLSTLALSARHNPHPQASHNMMRQQLLRSLPRSQRLASINATRAFTSSAPRPAEVELTIGTPAHDTQLHPTPID